MVRVNAADHSLRPHEVVRGVLQIRDYPMPVDQRLLASNERPRDAPARSIMMNPYATGGGDRSAAGHPRLTHKW